jgi:dolichol-phosphate mannosyltransferase
MRTLSIVIPVYSEADVLVELHRRLKAVLSPLKFGHEIIFVDDGSRDNSFTVLSELARTDPCTRVLRFSRNFGQQIAVTAGLDHARGDAVVAMDADLQDEPEMIPQFIDRWEEGYDVVYNVRGRRQGMAAHKRAGTGIFYELMKRYASIDMPQNVGLFRLMDRRVVDAVREMRETNRFLPGMFAWAGFRQIGIPGDRPDRAGGKAKSLRKLIALGLDGVLSFSNFPLRLALWLGLAISSFSFLYGLYVVVRKFAHPGAPLYGWTSTIVAILFFGGVQLVFLGIIGEYIGRLYDEVKRRPLYLVRERLNFGKDMTRIPGVRDQVPCPPDFTEDDRSPSAR